MSGDKEEKQVRLQNRSGVAKKELKVEKLKSCPFLFGAILAIVKYPSIKPVK